MHTGTVTRLARAGLLALVLSGTASAHAWADGTNGPPIVVVPLTGSTIGINVQAPGGMGSGGAPAGGGVPAGNGSGGGAPAGGTPGGGGGTVVPVGSAGAYQGGSSVSSNPFFPGSVAPGPQGTAPCPAAGPAVCSVPPPPAAVPVAAPGAPAAPAAAPPPTSAQLALAAWGQLVMPSPVPSRYPSGTLKTDGHPYTIVNANTWFWTDPATWQPVSKTVTAGAVWGKATATPVSLSFTPGDGSSPVSCNGPGSEWKANEQTWLAPVNPDGCSYRYLNSSLGVGGDDQVTATYSITWNVTWSGSDGTGGAFNNMQTQTDSRFAVAEVQTVVVN